MTCYTYVVKCILKDYIFAHRAMREVRAARVMCEAFS